MQGGTRTVRHRDPLDVRFDSIQSMKRLLETRVLRRRDSFDNVNAVVNGVRT